MKPHSLRRGLWLANLALGAAVIGVGAWFALEVRPAVAKVVNRPVNARPPEFETLRKEYEGQRMTGLKWKPNAPVNDTELKAVILRPDYERKSPRHWIFSGPLPPADVVDSGPVETGPPPPQGLEVLGSVSVVIFNPPRAHTILFDFGGGRSLPFGLDEFVKKTDDEPDRFKIKGVEEVRPRVFEITYEVYGKDADKPERTGSMTYDSSDSSGYPGFLKPAGDPAPVATADAGEAGTGTQPAAGATGGGAAGTTADGEATPAAEDGEAKVIDVAGTRTEDLTLQDLKPEIEYNPRNRDQRAIKFDSNSYRYFRGKNASTVAETVKTNVAKDPATGRVLGLRITGFAENAPADVFDVRRGDILVSINGQKVTSRSEAIRIAQSIKQDQLVTVVIDRNGRQLTYRVDPSDPRTRRQVRYFENLK